MNLKTHSYVIQGQFGKILKTVKRMLFKYMYFSVYRY